jgi:hypothetical protein
MMMPFLKILPKRTILNFSFWFVLHLILYFLIHEQEILYNFTLIGLPVILVVVYFFSVFKRRYVLPAMLGLGLSVALTMWVI